MNIVLTARRDGVLYIDEDGNEHQVYDGYEVHIDDAVFIQTSEEDGKPVIEIFYPIPEGDAMYPEDMYPLSDWDVFVK